MRRITPPLAISLSLLLGLQTASADENATTHDSSQQVATQPVQHRPRLHRRAIRQQATDLQATSRTEPQPEKAERLPVRAYHLSYITATDARRRVEPLCSKQGKVDLSPATETRPDRSDSDSENGERATGARADNGTASAGAVLIVQDHEDVLKRVDRLIAEIDVKPAEVLIEAAMVEVTLNKDVADSGVDLASIKGTQKALKVAGDAINAASGFDDASVSAEGASPTGGSGGPNGWHFGRVDGDTTSFIRALERFGETKVIASPRLLVLDKQRAEIHIGGQLGYLTTTVNQTSTIKTVTFKDVGTVLRVRPSVAPDGIVRLEAHVERSTGRLDPLGIPQLDVQQITTNITVPNAATIMLNSTVYAKVTQDRNDNPLPNWISYLESLLGNTQDDVYVKKQLFVLLTPRIWKR